MKCDKSFKRTMLVAWGMNELADGKRMLEDVRVDINRMMRWKTEKIRAFVATKGEAGK